MEDAVQILLVFFGPGWLTTAKLGGARDRCGSGRRKDRRRNCRLGSRWSEWAQLASQGSGGPGRAGKGSPSLLWAPEVPGWPKSCWTAGRSSRRAGDSLRTPGGCPGRATVARARPTFPAAHPKGTGKSLVLCAFFSLLGRLVSKKMALACARDVVRRCARQLSQCQNHRAVATRLQCAKSNQTGIGRELRRLPAPGKGARARGALRRSEPGAQVPALPIWSRRISAPVSPAIVRQSWSPPPASGCSRGQKPQQRVVRTCSRAPEPVSPGRPAVPPPVAHTWRAGRGGTGVLGVPLQISRVGGLVWVTSGHR